MGFTIKYNEVKIVWLKIKPSSLYFLFDISLLFNYFLTIKYLYSVYFSSMVYNLQQFSRIRNKSYIADEPVDKSIEYLFVGIYIGSFFDTLAFNH